MEEPIFIPSNQGNQWILYKKHCFYKWCTRDNGQVYWKCVFARRGSRKWECKASIPTIAMNLEIKEENGNHVDHPNFSSIDTRLLQCLDTVTKRLRNEYGSINIFRDEINRIIEEDYSIDEIATKMPKFENVKDKLYKARNKDIQTLPKNIQHVDLTSERYSNTKYKTRFLLFDTNDKERIIAYASDNQLQILSKSQRWHIDGKFKCCPSIYYQIFTIHAWYSEHMYFCVTMFLIGKSTMLYSKALREMQRVCSQMGIETRRSS